MDPPSNRATDLPGNPVTDLPGDTAQQPAVRCDMTGATDTLAERIAEYRRLFTQFLLGRSRTSRGIRFRIRADPGVEDWVRDLARREHACCPFFQFTVKATGQEVWWDASVVDDQAARQVLAEFYRLPDTLADSDAAVRQRFHDHGLFAERARARPPSNLHPPQQRMARSSLARPELSWPRSRVPANEELSRAVWPI